MLAINPIIPPNTPPHTTNHPKWGFQSEGTKIFSKHLDKRYNGMLQSNESGCIQIEPLL
jgi:hypothetical protein